MEQETGQIDFTPVPLDAIALLQENNRLLHDIKRQNKVLIKQNYLNHQYQDLHTKLCFSKTKGVSYTEKQNRKTKHRLASKIKETYMTERLTDLSWSASNEDK
jgi:hypothetical protein